MVSKKTTLLSTILTLIILPIISAYNGWNSLSYYNTPIDFLQNPWVMFGLIFIILFGIIFYVLNKSFKNTAIASSIALGLSLFISMAVAQRGLLDSYGYGELSSWALVIASLIGIAFLIRFGNENFGRKGAAITIGIFWLIMYNLEPYRVLPNSLLNSGFFRIYETLFSGTWGIILGIVAIILAYALSGEGTQEFRNDVRDEIRFLRGR